MQGLTAGVHRFGADEGERDYAWHFPVVDPVMDRAALNHHVAGFEPHRRAIEDHVDLARHHHRIIDGIGTVVARADAGVELHHAEHRTGVDAGPDLALGA